MLGLAKMKRSRRDVGSVSIPASLSCTTGWPPYIIAVFSVSAEISWTVSINPFWNADFMGITSLFPRD